MILIPFLLIIHSINRQLAEDMPTKKGAFQPGQSAHFNGKILYKPCRKPVYTPSDWDPSLAERSSELPNARLVLDFIYGYQGKSNTAQNLFYTSEGKCVFYTAGVGIVYQRPPVHHQVSRSGSTRHHPPGRSTMHLTIHTFGPSVLFLGSL